MIQTFIEKGKIVDVEARKVHWGEVHVKDGVIESISKEAIESDLTSGPLIMPGLIESHIHIEDTLLTPYEFAKIVVSYGTVAAVCDPHEIGNVLGIPGVEYMIESGKNSPLKFFFGAPSCVPSSHFETTGAVLGPTEIDQLMARSDIHFLGEFMNYPAVIAGVPSEMAKIEAAHRNHKPVDGHAPGVRGEDLDKYLKAGISTDHECALLAEATEKIKKGMKIIVREGSAAFNLQELHTLIDEYPDNVMLCTDDLHPDDILYKGHMNYVIQCALAAGCQQFNVLRAATLNPIQHYKLPVGLLRKGDPGDFIVVESLQPFKVLKTYINGKLVYQRDGPELAPVQPKIVNNFAATPITVEDIKVKATGTTIKVIGVIDKQLLTTCHVLPAKISPDGYAVNDLERDLLKIVVVNRYVPTKPSVGFIKGFGLKSGALAISIAHDSHNLVCIGVADEDIVKVLNKIIEAKGGAAATGNGKDLFLPLPIAGLMSTQSAKEVGEAYHALQQLARELGSTLSSPFPTLTFMALPVIPELKITDKGLFNVIQWKAVTLFGEQ